MADVQAQLQRDAMQLLRQAQQAQPVGGPQKFDIRVKGHHGPNATPLTVMREFAEGVVRGVELTVLGGLMKDEALAAPMVAILALNPHGMTIEETCDKSLELADMLLARAEARRIAKAAAEAEAAATTAVNATL
jgi:hypothetical protein